MRGLSSLRPILHLFFQGRRKILLAGIALAAVTVLSGIGLLGLSGWFITATALAGLSVAAAAVFDVFVPAASIRLLAILRTGSRYAERLVTHDATLAILAALRERLFRSWAAPHAARELLRRPSRLLFRLTADIDALDNLYLRVLVPAGAALITALAVGVAFYLIDPALALVTIIILLIAGFGLPVIASRCAIKPMRRRTKATEALRDRAINLVSGQTDLLMAGRVEAQAASVLAADRYLSEADDQLNRIEVKTGAGFGITSALLLSGALLSGTLLVESGIIPSSIAALIILVSIAVIEPFSALRRGAMELGRTILAAKHIGSRFSAEPYYAVVDMPEDPQQAVSLDAVSVCYEDRTVPAIKLLSLSVKRGEKLAVIGASGAGKSTVMGLLAGEVKPSSGSVRHVPSTLLTQRTELFQDSLRDNLRLAQPQANDEQLMQALDDAGLGVMVRSLPQGLETTLGEGGLGLSGGQARRLALARLMLHNTPLWLLDEPTEALDHSTAIDILACLVKNTADKTLVVATHLAREAAIADRIIVLNDGHIVQEAFKGTAVFEQILTGLR